VFPFVTARTKKRVFGFLPKKAQDACWAVVLGGGWSRCYGMVLKQFLSFLREKTV
jgi:hypothetical protein